MAESCSAEVEIPLAREKRQEIEFKSRFDEINNKGQKECKYLRNITHWTLGIFEYAQRCFCCGTKIDEKRMLKIRDQYGDIMETTDCLAIELSTIMNSYWINCWDNPIIGTIFCPLATLLHLCCFPCVVICDCLSICIPKCDYSYTGTNIYHAQLKVLNDENRKSNCLKIDL